MTRPSEAALEASPAKSLHRLKETQPLPFLRIGPMRFVNGFPCRNCADEELARRGVDPAHPQREFSGNEVYVPPPENRTGPALGANQPSATGSLGRRLNLHA